MSSPVISSACTLFKTSTSLVGFGHIIWSAFLKISHFCQFSQVLSPKASAAIEATGPQESARQAILAAKAKAKQHEELVEDGGSCGNADVSSVSR